MAEKVLQRGHDEQGSTPSFLSCSWSRDSTSDRLTGAVLPRPDAAQLFVQEQMGQYVIVRATGEQIFEEMPLYGSSSSSSCGRIALTSLLLAFDSQDWDASPLRLGREHPVA